MQIQSGGKTCEHADIARRLKTQAHMSTCLQVVSVLIGCQRSIQIKRIVLIIPVPIRDYAIGLATPDPSGGKIIDILGALDDIATADDAMHDVAESIENLLKDLGFIEE